MDERIIIRKAKISDFQGIHNLIMQVHKLHVNDVALERAINIGREIKRADIVVYHTAAACASNDQGNIYLIAELENEIVGICFSQIKEISNNKIMKNRKILHIENICVDENHQKKGIGKKLYKQIVQLAKEKNIDNIELMVWGFNENAIKFYKNLGMNIKNLKFEQKISSLDS